MHRPGRSRAHRRGRGLGPGAPGALGSANKRGGCGDTGQGHSPRRQPHHAHTRHAVGSPSHPFSSHPIPSHPIPSHPGLGCGRPGHQCTGGRGGAVAGACVPQSCPSLVPGPASPHSSSSADPGPRHVPIAMLLTAMQGVAELLVALHAAATHRLAGSSLMDVRRHRRARDLIDPNHRTELHNALARLRKGSGMLVSSVKAALLHPASMQVVLASAPRHSPLPGRLRPPLCAGRCVARRRRHCRARGCGAARRRTCALTGTFKTPDQNSQNSAGCQAPWRHRPQRIRLPVRECAQTMIRVPIVMPHSLTTPPARNGEESQGQEAATDGGGLRRHCTNPPSQLSPAHHILSLAYL